MKTTKNIARLAVTAGLTAVLSFGGVMAPVTMAFAEGGSTVTFEDPSYSTTTTYKGIQIFAANVSGSTATNIQWAGSGTQQTAIQEAVVGAINEWSTAHNKGAYTSTNAQDAAEWLNTNAGVDGTDSRIANDNVLKIIAKKLSTDNFTWNLTTQGNNTLAGLDAGYWLFLTADVSKPTEGSAASQSIDVFTSPIFKLVNGADPVNITPKKKIPTVEKKILDDAAVKENLSYTQQSGWSDVADSQIGQEVNYKLTGTIADNYVTYDSYAYKFTDVLSNGLDYVNGSVEVYAFDGTDYTKINVDKYDAKCDGKTLTVEFKVGDGKKGLKDVTGVTADTKIVVFYKAKLNSNAVIGNSNDGSKDGNPNTVKLEYSNNPFVEGTGETIEDTVADFAFKLNLNKVDQGTEKGLGGAVFTIQSADTNTKDQYIASTEGTVDGASVVAGQLVTVANVNNLPECVKFTSGADGNIAVSGLDAGSYTVTEIKTPSDKYTEAKPFTFTITPTYDNSTMKVSGLKAEVSEDDKNRTDIAFCKLDGVAGDNVLKKEDGAQFDVDKGEITVFVGNTKQINLPLTGLNGVTFTWIAGGAVLCIGVAHLIRSRKRDEGSEE
mgnify:CR=1 FL=1